MKIEIGNYIRIAGDFPSNRNLQNEPGTDELLSNQKHPREYLVKLDGGILSPHLAGMLVCVPSSKLELLIKIDIRSQNWQNIRQCG